MNNECKGPSVPDRKSINAEAPNTKVINTEVINTKVINTESIKPETINVQTINTIERDNHNAWFVGACWRLVWAATVGFILLLTFDAQSAVFDSEFSQTPAKVPLETVIKPTNYAGLHLSKQEAGERFCAEQTHVRLQNADDFNQYTNFRCFWYDPRGV